jgi:hypothetical protein
MWENLIFRNFCLCFCFDSICNRQNLIDFSPYFASISINFKKIEAKLIEIHITAIETTVG